MTCYALVLEHYLHEEQLCPGPQEEQECPEDGPPEPGEAKVEKSLTRSFPPQTLQTGFSPDIMSSSIFFLHLLQ